MTHACPLPCAVRRRACGFTLVEALVALVILGIVAVLAYRGTAALTGGEAALAQESARWRTLDQVFGRLEGDMREALPRTARRGGAREAAWSAQPDDAAGNTTLVFSRAGPEFSADPGRAGQRVGYRVHDGALEVLYWPAPDNVADRAPAGFVLLPGVARFRVSQLAADGTWSPQWPLRADDDVPRAVQVELVLDDGTKIERWFALR